ALKTDEVPVGCVFVHNGKIIGKGMNDTNRSLCGTRHAEFVALESILKSNSPTIFQETDLYVTVEPCIMCASALRQLKIRAVYFGCLNDRFGGCGGVFHIDQDPSIDPPYPCYGGVYREEAIMLLRRFYIQENERAPAPIAKKNRELKTEIASIEVMEGRAAILQVTSPTVTPASVVPLVVSPVVIPAVPVATPVIIIPAVPPPALPLRPKTTQFQANPASQIPTQVQPQAQSQSKKQTQPQPPPSSHQLPKGPPTPTPPSQPFTLAA
ncbi:cytidine deaminase-like protein, partial [Peziza echinospora]